MVIVTSFCQFILMFSNEMADLDIKSPSKTLENVPILAEKAEHSTIYKYRECEVILEDEESKFNDQENVDPQISEALGRKEKSSTACLFQYPAIYDCVSLPRSYSRKNTSPPHMSPPMTGDTINPRVSPEMRQSCHSSVCCLHASMKGALTPCKTTSTPISNERPVFRTPSQTSSRSLNDLLATHTPQNRSRNPFELCAEKFGHATLSPSLFKQVISPESKVDENFHWSIDQLAELNPAPIDGSDHHSDPDHDPEFEHRAQLAIDRFFTHHSVVPSPWTGDSKSGVNRFGPHLLGNENDSLSWCSKNTCSVWTQTSLSLPPILPPELEAMLKPYFNAAEQWNNVEAENEDSNGLNNTTLRRKLRFGCDDSSLNLLISSSPIMDCHDNLPTIDRHATDSAVFKSEHVDWTSGAKEEVLGCPYPLHESDDENEVLIWDGSMLHRSSPHVGSCRESLGHGRRVELTPSRRAQNDRGGANVCLSPTVSPIVFSASLSIEKNGSYRAADEIVALQFGFEHQTDNSEIEKLNLDHLTPARKKSFCKRSDAVATTPFVTCEMNQVDASVLNDNKQICHGVAFSSSPIRSLLQSPMTPSSPTRKFSMSPTLSPILRHSNCSTVQCQKVVQWHSSARHESESDACDVFHSLKKDSSEGLLLWSDLGSLIAAESNLLMECSSFAEVTLQDTGYDTCRSLSSVTQEMNPPLLPLNHQCHQLLDTDANLQAVSDSLMDISDSKISDI